MQYNMLEEIINFEREKLEERGYEINNRKFSEIWPIIERAEMIPREKFNCNDKDIVYSGAEYNGTPKLPNITFLPNIRKGYDWFMGQTLGHQHLQKSLGDTRRFQEIYEFLGYGAMLLRNPNETILYVLKPQDKVLVGTGDNMTLFNLDNTPLITLDYANPKMNKANKDLEKRIGPLMIATHLNYTEMNTTLFKINPKYINENLLKCEKDTKNSGLVHWGNVKVPSEASRFMIGMNDTGLGTKMYDALKQGEMTEADKKEYEKLKKREFEATVAFYLERFQNHADLFAKLGIKVIHESNIPRDLEKEFSPPLLELALTQNKTLLNCLGM